MQPYALALPGKIHGFTLEETLSIAERADRSGFHSLWKGEASGLNAFVTLGAVAQRTDSIGLGTGIANVFSRSPALLAMSAATLDELSDGRAILGLGVSTEAVVEDWHGLPYEDALRRLRETIEIVRMALEEGAVEYDGSIFDVGPYPGSYETPQSAVRIVNSAIGPTNRRLTGEFADGWMPVFCPKDRLADLVAEVEDHAAAAGRDPEDVVVAPWIPVGAAEDRSLAERRARELLAQEMAMGYDRVLARHGYEDTASRAAQAWRAGDREAAADEITDDVVSAFSVTGTPDEVADQLDAYRDRGVDWPILWTSPTAEVSEVEYLVDGLAE